MFNYCRQIGNETGNYFLIPNMRFTFDDLNVGMDGENLTFEDEIEFLTMAANEKSFHERKNVIFFSGRAQTEERVSFAEYCKDET